jgi:two-component system, response regulator
MAPKASDGLSRLNEVKAMKTIFLVEDDSVISHLYRARFLSEGFQVEVAEDGLSAMKALATLRPDVIVLDLILPFMNGVDVLKYIRSTPELKATPVIILSEAYMSELAAAAAAVGAEQTLLKSSCTPNLLMDVINNLLGGGACQIDPSIRLAAPTPPAKPQS